LKKSNRDLFVRYDQNPILREDMWPYEINSVFNPGAVRLANGKTLLFCRVEDKTGKSHLTKAISFDGIGDWHIDSEPTYLPELDIRDNWGIEDPRITYLTDVKKYAVVYTAYGTSGPSIALSLTTDFTNFERLGTIIHADDKDAALFPRQIDGRWVLIHRPMNDLGSNMWISFSKDLVHWGDHKLFLETREGSFWDSYKIGLATPPIETKEGWLIIYHGVRITAAGAIYRIGLALFDLNDPQKCIKRGNEWIFGPKTTYELLGDVGNVIFPCGFTILPDNDTIYLYYGAADTCIGLAFGSISRMLLWLHEQ